MIQTLSACCEHKYKQGSRFEYCLSLSPFSDQCSLGGVFKVLRINGGDKCIKCKMQARLQKSHIPMPETGAYETSRAQPQRSTVEPLHRPKMSAFMDTDELSVASMPRLAHDHTSISFSSTSRTNTSSHIDHNSTGSTKSFRQTSSSPSSQTHASTASFSKLPLDLQSDQRSDHRAPPRAYSRTTSDSAQSHMLPSVSNHSSFAPLTKPSLIVHESMLAHEQPQAMLSLSRSHQSQPEKTQARVRRDDRTPYEILQQRLEVEELRKNLRPFAHPAALSAISAPADDKSPSEPTPPSDRDAQHLAPLPPSSPRTASSRVRRQFVAETFSSASEGAPAVLVFPPKNTQRVVLMPPVAEHLRMGRKSSKPERDIDPQPVQEQSAIPSVLNDLTVRS
jgi:hypothetical protein